MIDVAVIRENAAADWIAKVLASAASSALPAASHLAGVAAAYPAAAAALRAALREVDDAIATADDWSVTVARHQVFLARRTMRDLLDATALAGPDSRLEWCQCGEEPMAA